MGGGTAEQRLGQYGVGLLDSRVMGKLGIGDHGANPCAAIVQHLNPVQSQSMHVDNMIRLHNVELDQIQQCGATCQVGTGRVTRMQ
ncbi:hypothetical protein D3C80_1905150 [compost metagenome]